MTTTVSISPMLLDFNNNTLRLDRKWPRANGWQKYVEESTYAKVSQEVSSEIFDEQIRVVDFTGAPIADLLYYVEHNGKKVLSGRTNAEGLTERIESGVATKEYIVYWGEDALIRTKNLL